MLAWFWRGAACGWLVLCIACHAEPELLWPTVKREIQQEFPQVRQLSTADLAAWLADESRQPPILLDARSKEEFEVSHLRRARWAPDLESAKEVIGNGDHATPIVVYCSVGYRSSRLSQELQKKGFQNVHNLEGSLFEWANEGRALYRNEAPARYVHPFDEKWGTLLELKLHWPGTRSEQRQ